MDVQGEGASCSNYVFFLPPGRRRGRRRGIGDGGRREGGREEGNKKKWKKGRR
jgi:hypothetical protein